MPASLFLDWYEVGAGAFTEIKFTVDGWDAFEATDVLMVVTAVAAASAAIAAPRYAGVALMLLGGLAAAVIGVQLIDKPAILGLFDVPGVSPRIGAWLGLLGALLILTSGGLIRFASAQR
jgi:hypothetical protein